MNNTKKPIIIIAGPTASGKTAISIALAKRLHGEIISGDSMQIYKDLDIGTAKIKSHEMQGIPHHLIDIKEPSEEYNVQQFQKDAKALISDIYSRNHIPIIVGGTGLYIDALLYDYQFSEEDTDHSIRDKLWKEYDQYGKDYIHSKLKAVDPESIEKIGTENIKRMIRALEVFEKKGIKFSSLEKDAKLYKSSPYDFFYFVLTMNRKHLYDRINNRVEAMFEQGWLLEVQKLLENNKISVTDRSMKSLGYKQILQYFANQIDLETTKETIKKETRRFAKRQLTWFRKNKDVIWVDKNDRTDSEILDEMINYL